MGKKRNDVFFFVTTSFGLTFTLQLNVVLKTSTTSVLFQFAHTKTSTKLELRLCPSQNAYDIFECIVVLWVSPVTWIWGIQALWRKYPEEVWSCRLGVICSSWTFAVTRNHWKVCRANRDGRETLSNLPWNYIFYTSQYFVEMFPKRFVLLLKYYYTFRFYLIEV